MGHIIRLFLPLLCCMLLATCSSDMPRSDAPGSESPALEEANETEDAIQDPGDMDKSSPISLDDEDFERDMLK